MATEKLTRKQIYYLMGAWDEQRTKGKVRRKCPICRGMLTVKDLDNGAYQVTCSTADCVDRQFRGF